MDYVCTLSPELLQKAKEKLNEDEKRRNQDLQAIREWLKKQPHINAKTDAKFLVNFLRGCKFSLERTKTKMDLFYTLKTALPEFYSGWDAFRPEIQDALKIGSSLPLPGLDRHGRKVILFRAGAQDPNKYRIEDIQKASLMISEILLEECEEMFITGIVLVIDMRGYTMSHFTQTPLPMAKKMMMIFQDASHLRPQAFYHIYTPSVFHTVYNLMQGLMNEKTKKRMKVLGEDLDELYKDVSKDVLPKDYGGDNLSVAELTEYWKKKVEDNRDWLLEQEKFRVDESKRPGKPKTSQDLFGIEGSFRKLEID